MIGGNRFSPTCQHFKKKTKKKLQVFMIFLKTMASRLKTFSSKTFSLCWSWKWKSEKQKKITQNIIDTNIYFSILTPDTWKTFQNLFKIKFKKETCNEQNQLPISIVDKEFCDAKQNQKIMNETEITFHVKVHTLTLINTPWYVSCNFLCFMVFKLISNGISVTPLNCKWK